MKVSRIFAALAVCCLVSCEKESVEPTNPTNTPSTETFVSVDGYVQKGPFLNGTSVTVAELQANLAQTGKAYQTLIVDNRGTFALRDLELRSPYVQLRADGFYYNEVTDETSSAQLTLHALSNLADQRSLNVNLLTTLERGRVEYLVQEGEPFDVAKARAQREILQIFEMAEGSTAHSEQLDISNPGDENAKLLAISVILQGRLEVGDLSELVANLSADIRPDGLLDTEALRSQLINNASLLHPPQIRQNLEGRYANLGVDAVIPPFEKYVLQFIDSTAFIRTNTLTYPTNGQYGLNLLGDRPTSRPAGEYSLAAELPDETTLRVVVGGANWAFPASQMTDDWAVEPYRASDTSYLFTATRTGNLDFELFLALLPTGGSSANSGKQKRTTFIEVYENDSTVPAWGYTFVVE